MSGKGNAWTCLRQVSVQRVSDHAWEIRAHRQEPLKINTCRYTLAVEQVDKVLKACVSGGAGRVGASANSACAGIEVLNALIKGGHHVCKC
jgi:hypothetical protein